MKLKFSLKFLLPNFNNLIITAKDFGTHPEERWSEGLDWDSGYMT
jgi:hypothetical protein